MKMLKENEAHHSWCREEEAGNDSSFRTMPFNSFKGIQINYAQNEAVLYYLYNSHALKQRGKQKIS